MLLEILPAKLKQVFENKVSLSDVSEIRLRVNKPVAVNVKGKLYYLAEYGLCSKLKDAIFVDYETIKNILYSATEASVYSVNNQLKEGFITIKGGYRIGIVGEVVYDDLVEKVVTIRNISSLNIRIPHFIKDCSKPAFDYLIEDTFLNTLIISPPGVGKTTFLRDLIFQISENNYALNSLILDERYEIAGMSDGECQFNIGQFVDVMSGVKKKYGFEVGVRSMSPNVIFTDELATEDDIYSVEYAIACGVSVVATVHSKNISTLKTKPNFDKVIKDKLFKRYIVLSTRNGLGTIEGVYDENLNLIYRE